MTAADLVTLDRAIASGVLEVRAADGSTVKYRSMADLLSARALVASESAGANADPLQVPGGVTYAVFSRD
jgi:hypothetical protein